MKARWLGRLRFTLVCIPASAKSARVTTIIAD
jgi:hypothetical protein